MAAECLTTITEQWIREKLQLKHPFLGDVRSLSLPGTHEEKIRRLGNSLNNFIRLKSLDLSCNALVSIKGVQHLKVLERLILYYNCIPSLEELKVLFELSALRELDLRLNPLTKRYPGYRPCLVHAMPNLRKLDGSSVRDDERKAAIMQFSSDHLPLQKSLCLTRVADQRSCDQRLAFVDPLTKGLSLLTDTDDVVLNFVGINPRDQSATQAQSVPKEATEDESNDFTEQRSSTPKQETAKSILRYPSTKYDIAMYKVPHVKEPSHKRSPTSLEVTERPKVSFGPYVEKCRPVAGKLKQNELPKPTRQTAKGHYTPNPDQSHGHSSTLANIRPPSPRRPGLNLSDLLNPILHPPRLTSSSVNKTEGGSGQQGEKKKRGSYRKPLEMLLNLVDKHWTGERSLHHNNNFLSQAVQILSMMESDISSREAEVRTLRGETDALSAQAAAREEEHKSEVRGLSAQLEKACSGAGKLNEQLKIVLEENVALQKQLIKLERQYLKSMMRSSPITQIKAAQTEVEELRKEIEGLRLKVHEAEKVKDLSNMLQESHRRTVGDRMELENQKQNIDVEVHVKSHSTAKKSEVRIQVLGLLNRHGMLFGNYKWTEFDKEFLQKNVESVAIVDQDDLITQPLDLKSYSVSIHIFTLNEDGPSTLSLEEDEELSAANHWLLPAAEFNGIWESLVYESGVKTQLLNYISTTIYFSDKNVDSNLISWNRVVLLHGPPGTGKTSLCKALAQKLSIRLSSRYSYGQFVEINSHSLFSKWFSESGKLVTKMFQKIQQLIDDKEALVFVLIDEVESLTAARSASQAGTEPSDAIRVVNSVLTQLDQIKRHSNVVILTTSNVTQKIDLAFVDRADIKQYIGPPSEKGIYNIYLSCLEELMKCQIIYPRQQLFTMFELETMGFAMSEVSEHSLTLRDIAVRSKGLSGRALRKLPFLAHALFVKTPTVTLERFLEAMTQAVDKQMEETANLVNAV